MFPSQQLPMDGAMLLAAAQRRVGSTLSTIPQQLESATESIGCVVMSSMDGEDHLEFNFDRSVFKQIRGVKEALAFNAAELTALLVSCSVSAASNWSSATSDKVSSVLKHERICQVLASCTSALVCTLSEPTAATAWARPAVKLAVVGSFMFPVLELADTHRSIFGVYVQADGRRCDSLCTAIADDPPHAILKTHIADALVSVLCTFGQ